MRVVLAEHFADDLGALAGGAVEIEPHLMHREQNAAVYRYRSPQQRSRTVERHLADIALYALQVDVWLSDLASLTGIEDRRRSDRRNRVPGERPHLGEVRIGGVMSVSFATPAVRGQ